MISESLVRVLVVGGLLGAIAATHPGIARAQQSSEDLARAAQNPLASMVSLPLQWNVNLDAGPKQQTQHVLNIQPVYPFRLNADWNVITRTIVPVIKQPDFGLPDGAHSGLGDVQLSVYLSPSKTGASGWIWGAGAVAQLPTASDDALGQGKWALGPTAVALRIRPGSPWVYGALFSNLWSVAGESARPSVNRMTLQPFVNYNFPAHPGRYLSFSPIVTADWKATSDNVWTLPLGLGIGQIFRIGAQPVNAQVAAYRNVVRPDYAPSWNVRFQLQFMFPQ